MLQKLNMTNNSIMQFRNCFEQIQRNNIVTKIDQSNLHRDSSMSTESGAITDHSQNLRKTVISAENFSLWYG
ncbi:MAG: hypothetical protein LBB88_09125, partial [Planctomycetaceae bacterium]|nr:hypothetical protein [Planctomycetaceae bacterium]